MAEINSKIETLELMDGNTVTLTLNFKRLLWLRGNGYEKQVNKAMKLFSTKQEDIDILDFPLLIWAAYLCANLEPAYTEDEFIGLLPWDLTELGEVIASLNAKKKGTPSKKRSNA